MIIYALGLMLSALIIHSLSYSQWTNCWPNCSIWCQEPKHYSQQFLDLGLEKVLFKPADSEGKT